MNTPKPPSRLRQRLPEILLETASVIVAVLLALAVDEWREEQEIAERAMLVEQAIRAEIASNRNELIGAVDARVELMTSLQDTLAAIGTGEAQSLSVNFDLTLLSDSAWVAAQYTGALTRLPFESVNEYSQYYQVQDLYDESQRNLMNHILSVSELVDPDQQALARGFISRLGMVIQLQEAILEAMGEMGIGDSP